MAGIQLLAELEPKNSGSFALLDDKYLRGGLRIVETFDELSLIPTDRLKDGCLVMVTTPSRVLYVYDQANDAWSPFSSGGGGGGSDWLCVEDGETTRLVKDVESWTQKIVVINHIRTYDDYFALPTEYVQNNEVAYCKTDSSAGTTTYKKGLYSYDAEKASWVEVNSTIEIDSALSDTSKRPVQNRIVTKALEEKVSKDDVDNVISKHSSNPVENRVIATALENIKNSKTMTAEEYDALDDETKNDGSFYYISDTGEIYQNEIIYGGKQIFDVTQEEYDALTDEEKAINEYHCTDTGRIYINGILYGDKKPIELTFEEYKQLEADGLVEPDVDYVIVSDEKGILLASEDVGYKDKTVHEALVTLQEDVLTAKDEIANPIKTTLDITLAENDCDNIPSLMEDLTTVVCTVGADTVAHTPKDTFSTETGFFEITTTRQNSTYAWQTAKKLAEKSNAFQRCLLNGVWSDWTSIGSIRNEVTNDVNTWSSSKIASEISAKGIKTQYRGSRSIDINTGGKLTLIFSSEYASQAGCYMLLSNYNTEPLLIELGRNNIGQFSVTATHKSNSVDTITVTAAGDEYSWYVLQF